jgi:WD40 repeat protein
MSIDFHPSHSNLIATGFYDGSVNVFDLKSKSKIEPKFTCLSANGKHKDPVWQVNVEHMIVKEENLNKIKAKFFFI